MNGAFPRLKRFVRMVFGKTQSSLYSLWRSSIPWYRYVSDVLQSSTVAVTLQWCARNFPEAPPALWKKGEGQDEQVVDHPMLRLLEKPNEYYSGVLLLMATIMDYKADGNAYWFKVRSGIGRPDELWWAPSWTVNPVGDEGEYVKYYEYTPDSTVAQPVRVDRADVVHFRNGMDPNDPKRGISPLKSVLREVYTDDEAATFTAAILTNMGVPGVVISPEGEADVTDDDLELTKSVFDSKLNGSQRGGAVVMRGPTKVAQFGFSPEQLVLRDIRRIPEERVSAALGVPAVVVGLGAGLDRSTFTNMVEAGETAYSNGLIPDQRIIADAIRWQLLTEFEDDPFMWKFGFDLSEVRALQGDRDRRSTRLNAELNAGGIMVSEYRRDLGYVVVPARDDVFLRQGNLTMVHGDDSALTPLAPSSNGNGNGRVPALSGAEGSG